MQNIFNLVKETVSFGYRLNKRPKGFSVGYLGSSQTTLTYSELELIQKRLAYHQIYRLAEVEGESKILVKGRYDGSTDKLAEIDRLTGRVKLDGALESLARTILGGERLVEFKIRKSELSLANFIRLCRELENLATADDIIKEITNLVKSEPLHFYVAGDDYANEELTELDRWQSAKTNAQLALLTMVRANARSCMMNDPLDHKGRTFKLYTSSDEWLHPFVGYNNITDHTQWSLVLASTKAPEELQGKVLKEFPFIARGWAWGCHVDSWYGVEKAGRAYRSFIEPAMKAKWGVSYRAPDEVYVNTIDVGDDEYLLPYVDGYIYGVHHDWSESCGMEIRTVKMTEWRPSDEDYIQCDTKGYSNFEPAQVYCHVTKEYINYDDAIYIESEDVFVGYEFAKQDRNGNWVFDTMEIIRFFND